MAPDSVHVTGGAAPVTGGAAPATASRPPRADRSEPAPAPGFGDALQTARSVASRPALPSGAPSEADLARGRELGLRDGAARDVLGRRYASIEGGPEHGRHVNTSENPRHGRTFEIVHRDGHVYHVYADVAVRVRSVADAGGTDADAGDADARSGSAEGP